MSKTPSTERLLRRLRLRHIELLDVLGQVGNMRLAAERLSLSQPAVSKMLSEIEVAFGAKLFERSRAGVKPSAVGSVAIRQARIICSEVDVTAEAVGSALAGRGPLLRIGALTVTALAPKAIATLRKEYPGTIVHIREGGADVLIDLLMANEIDCVVGAISPRAVSEAILEHLDLRSISLDRLCFIVSPNHKLAARKRLSLKELATADWVLPQSPTMVRQAFVAACLQQGIEPPIPAVESFSPLTLSHLVRSDATLVGVARAEQLRGELDTFALRELPVYPQVALPSISFLARRNRTRLNPLVDAFLSALGRV